MHHLLTQLLGVCVCVASAPEVYSLSKSPVFSRELLAAVTILYVR